MNIISIILSVSLCGTCHPETSAIFEKSIHRIEGIQCISCHGGDSNTLDEKDAHSRNFKIIPRIAIPSHCGSCHSNPVMMKPYGIPTDQLREYLSSKHGKDFEKNLKKPTCTDCHGVHDILKKDEPDSLTNPSNIVKVCGKCHGGKGSVVEDYLASYHYEAWRERKNSPICTTCHDPHLPIKFRAVDIDKLCGRCHSSSRESFMEGPHGKSFAEKGAPSCKDCHGSHQIKRSKSLELSRTCEDCHSKGSSEFETGEKISVMLSQTKEEIEKAEKTLDEAEQIPIAVEDYKARIEEAKTFFTEALTLTHSLSLERSEEVLGRARFISKEIEREIHEKTRNLKWRRFGLFVFWFYLFLTIFIILRYKRWIAKRKSEK